jgi:hypothetical protein
MTHEERIDRLVEHIQTRLFEDLGFMSDFLDDVLRNGRIGFNGMSDEGLKNSEEAWEMEE